MTALRNAAFNAVQQRQFGPAAAALQQWLAENPADADAWFNLGLSHRQLLQPLEAIAAYRRALAADVALPEQAHLNIAAIEGDVLHDAAAARTSLQAALAIEPGFVLAWQNLGQLEEDVGNGAAARAAYEAALVHAPGLGRAHARLAGIDVFEGRPQQALDRLEAAGRMTSRTDDLIELAFAAANALDAKGDYDEAFNQALDANELQKHSGSLRYHPAGLAAQVSALIDLFPPAPLPSPRQGIRPIFICGLFRSGSTLLESLLHRQLGIAMGGELAFTPWYALHHGAGLTPEGRDDFVSGFASGYTSFARTVLGDVAQFTDKRMDNFLFLGAIKRAFPDALIVHCMRNPIDNFLSMFFLPFADTLSYANDFDDMLHYYRQYRRLMAHWQICFGDDIITVRYDDLVQDAAAALAPIQQRLGLAAMPAPATAPIIRTASVWQVRQPLHSRSSGRWRHYANQIGDLADALHAEFPDISQ